MKSLSSEALGKLSCVSRPVESRLLGPASILLLSVKPLTVERFVSLQPLVQESQHFTVSTLRNSFIESYVDT